MAGVDMTPFRKLPNPSNALCGEARLGPVSDSHSPLKFDEPVILLRGCADRLGLGETPRLVVVGLGFTTRVFSS